MGGIKGNVVVANVSELGGLKAIGGQELLDGKVRKLDNF
jgi:hypothetical protein